MSLVVAQTTSSGPRIVSDTRVSYFDGTRPSYKSDTLKAIVVNKQTTVCFAGDVESGLSAIRHFAGDLANRTPAIPASRCLESAAQDTNVDFIVASSDAAAPLTRITRRGTERLSVAWIGDPEAFEAFQAARHRYRTSPANEVYRSLPAAAQVLSELGSAMDAVIESSEITTVDHFCVRVSAGNAEFEYLGGVSIVVGRDFQIRDGDSLIAKMAQSVSVGGFTMAIVPPAKKGVPALGVSFPRARLGLLYAPLSFDGAQVIKDVGVRDFAKSIRDLFGVQLQEPMIR